MSAISLVAGLTTLAISFYLLCFRGGFWRWNNIRGDPPATSHIAPSIVAIVPARDEASLVVASVGSLASQKYPGPFHIVLIDDGSTDRTAEAARAAAPADLLTIERAAPLPPGWTGKLWALSEGVRHAARFPHEYLLFTDADIVHPPDNLARLAVSDCDLVSYMATLSCKTVAERALVPAFVFFFFMLYPPPWIRDSRRRTAGAAGGCILIRRSMLDRIGGLAAICGELIDDCALAAAVKRQGGKLWLALSADTRSIREYGGFGEIGRMISRTAFTQLRYSPLLLIGTVLGLVLTYFVPPYLVFTAPVLPAALGGAAWLLMSIAYLPALRFYHRSLLWAPCLPLIATFYLGATIHSAIAYWRGKGGAWKGRAHPRLGKPPGL